MMSQVVYAHLRHFLLCNRRVREHSAARFWALYEDCVEVELLRRIGTGEL